ncbi:MAG: arsenite methyltransferase [bacterium]
MNENIKTVVREGYAKIAENSSSCCGTANADQISKKIGYSDDELKAVPENANLGLGCGNPVALASIKEGETVVDLGSGAGFDCFLAANQVGPTGTVIGVDMTQEMLDKARRNAQKGDYRNVEFRLGEIEHLPIANKTADLIMSNCVINLSPDKKQVFKEAFRVLKPGGRFMISDIVLRKDLPEFIRSSLSAYVGCISGAVLRDSYLGLIREAGFQDIEIIDETEFPIDGFVNDPTAQTIIQELKVSQETISEIAKSVVSLKVYGVKPFSHLSDFGL